MARNRYNKITITKKAKIICDSEEKKLSIKDLAEKYKLPRTTISSILSSSQKIKGQRLVKSLATRCRERTSRYPGINAWDDVEPLTIKHCFKKAMPDIVEHSPATQPITPQISVPEESTRTLITSDADSSEEGEIEESGKDVLNDDDKQEEPAPKVKPKEVFQALNTLLFHSSRNGPSEEFAFLSNYLRKYSLEVDSAKKQTLMTDYFTKPSNSIC